MRSFLSILILLMIMSCQKNSVNISIDAKNEKGTLYLKEVTTDKIINKIEISDTSYTVSLDTEKPILTTVTSSYSEGEAIAVFSPGDNKTILINKDSISISGSLQDSLANYLWKSTNLMFTSAHHGREIFGNSDPAHVKGLFDSLINKREKVISTFENELSIEIINLLKHQNKARAYSFLFYYGRMMNDIPAKSKYYDFIDQIDDGNYYSLYSPTNVLYKYETEYLRSDLKLDYESFDQYIGDRTDNEQLEELYRVVYLKHLIESPEYWKAHQNLFESKILENAISNLSDNKYSFLLKGLKNSLKSSDNGKTAFDFNATTIEGTKIQLSDYKGKYVLIDAWATWCGPCVKYRPDLIKIAEETSDKNIQFLMVSVDKNTDKWQSYIKNQRLPDNSLDVKISNDKIEHFRNKFFIPSIPRYILIDPEGKIIESDLDGPSKDLKEFLMKTVS
ncbi:TlpA disulfide reductase family protein [Mangrovivirga sp. M17]|uniref:TlpA disulfide reductase family protein n=1 Tax=Mangrovivirga halotolerans TaxID=2993936 RepID=A0ABT3RN08_9BACT|nr:TlpA disulfide reductase family protein [Mangrovivirga halotolerans]MCX2743149.1 TlpA disulfide reductase family protein [Mangrovivirga halotolerans]